jgi:arylsulfatase A-like enzyme
LLLDQGVATHDPRVFKNLKDDLVNDADGRFFFAHVLLPHDPYAFLHDCSINYEIPLWARHAPAKKEPVQSDEVYEIRTMKYFEQVDCALNSLGQIFEEMKTNEIFERSIIIVHGDHGSRIGKYPAKYENLDQLTPTDYRAHYSTLFAVKIPGQSGRVDNRVLSLGLLLEEFSKAVDGSVTNSEIPTVFMQVIPDEQEKVKPYIYLARKNALMRVDINVFDD